MGKEDRISKMLDTSCLVALLSLTGFVSGVASGTIVATKETNTQVTSIFAYDCKKLEVEGEDVTVRDSTFYVEGNQPAITLKDGSK